MVLYSCCLLTRQMETHIHENTCVLSLASPAETKQPFVQLRCPLMGDISVFVGPGIACDSPVLCPPSPESLRCDCVHARRTNICLSLTTAIFYLFAVSYFAPAFQEAGLERLVSAFLTVSCTESKC